MRNTQQIFTWLFLAIFSSSLISCVDNSEDETTLAVPENLPGAITYTQNPTDNFICHSGRAYVIYQPPGMMTILLDSAVVEEAPDSLKRSHDLKLTVRNISKLSDLDGKTLTMTDVNGDGDPIPYVKVNLKSQNPLTPGFDIDSKTAKLQIHKAGNGSLEAEFETYLEGGIDNQIKVKLTEGVIHKVPIKF